MNEDRKIAARKSFWQSPWEIDLGADPVNILLFLGLVGKELPLILAPKNPKDMLMKRRVSPSQHEFDCVEKYLIILKVNNWKTVAKSRYARRKPLEKTRDIKSSKKKNKIAFKRI
ncbi:hypothetical protein TNCV_3769941 [Trichonephila clavipes]|nr:hypothetical protein TNCV_3769941 [Trichonephila clavipes]